MENNANNTHFSKEPKPQKPILLTGTFLYYDQKNSNDRIYSKECAESMIDQCNKRIAKDEALGEFNPNYEREPMILLTNVSHKVNEVHLNEEMKSIEGTVEVFQTDAGKKLIEYITKGMNFSVASRGIGTVNTSTNEVENYELLSFDIIRKEDSSFKGNLTINDL